MYVKYDFMCMCKLKYTNVLTDHEKENVNCSFYKLTIHQNERQSNLDKESFNFTKTKLST